MTVLSFDKFVDNKPQFNEFEVTDDFFNKAKMARPNPPAP